MALIPTEPDFNVTKGQTEESGIIPDFTSPLDVFKTQAVNAIVGTIDSFDRRSTLSRIYSETISITEETTPAVDLTAILSNTISIGSTTTRDVSEALTPPQLNFGVTKDQSQKSSIFGDLNIAADISKAIQALASTVGVRDRSDLVISKENRETTSVIPTVLFASVFARVAAMAVGITDTAEAQKGFRTLLTDLVGIDETTRDRGRFALAFDEVSGILDSVANEAFIERAFIEAVGSIESVQGVGVVKSLSETSPTRDTANRSAFYERVFIEPIANIEAITSLGVVKPVRESVSVSEETSVASVFRTAFDETVSILDQVSKAGDLTESLSESIATLTTSATPAVFTRMREEAVSISERINFVKDLVRVMYQPVGIIEQNFPVPEELERLVMETRVAMQDEYVRILDLIRSFSETGGIIETESSLAGKVTSEVVGAVDDTIRGVSKTASEAVSSVATFAYLASLVRIFDESIAVRGLFISPLLAFRTALLNARVGITETFERRLDLSRPYSEVVSQDTTLSTPATFRASVDEVIRLIEETTLMGSKALDNTISVTDRVTSATTYQRLMAEVVGIRDAFTARLSALEIAAVSTTVGMQSRFDRTLDLQRAYTETIGTVEDAVAVSGLRSVLNEVVSISENTATRGSFVKSITDTIGVVTALSTPMLRFESLESVVGIATETPKRALKSVPGTIGVSDTFERTFELREVLDEAVGIVDDLESNISGLETLAIAAIVGVRDVRSSRVGKSVAEDVGIIDTEVLNQAISRIITEVVGVTGQVRFGATKSVSALVSPVEDRLLGVSKTVSDAVSIRGVVDSARVFPQNLTETVGQVTTIRFGVTKSASEVVGSVVSIFSAPIGEIIDVAELTAEKTLVASLGATKKYRERLQGVKELLVQMRAKKPEEELEADEDEMSSLTGEINDKD